MVTYEEALAIARERKQNIDMCAEWEKGFVFESEADANMIGGYGHIPIVVRKEDGKVMTMPEFVFGDAGELVREFKV